MSRGFQATVNYTYSHSLTDSQGNFGGATVGRANRHPKRLRPGRRLRAQATRTSGTTYPPTDRICCRSERASLRRPRQPRARPAGGRVDSFLHCHCLSRVCRLRSSGPTIPGPTTCSSGGSRANQYRKLKIRHQGVAHWFGTGPSAVPCSGPDNGTCAYGPAAPFTYGSEGSVPSARPDLNRSIARCLKTSISPNGRC